MLLLLYRSLIMHSRKSSFVFFIFLLLSLVLSVCCQNMTIYPTLNNTDGRCRLFVGVLLPSTQPNRSELGIKLAIDYINNQNLSSNYKLHGVQLDTQCNREQALRKLFQLNSEKQQSFAIVDAGCSIATEATAEISHLFGYSQVNWSNKIACRSSSPVLMNRVRFPQYFQLLPSVTEVSYQMSGLVQLFNWTQVFLFVQDTDVYRMIADQAETVFDALNITYHRYDLASDMDELFVNNNERVFIIITDETNAVNLLCTAYKKKSLPRIFITQYYSQKWNEKHKIFNCKLDEVLDRSFSVTHYEPVTQSVYQDFDPYCYDAMLFLATALNYTLSQVASCSGNAAEINLDTFFKNLQNLSEQNLVYGKTGEVVFDKFGIRQIKQTPVFQFRHSLGASLELVKFGYFNKTEKENYIFVYNINENIKTVFPDGVPYDGKVEVTITTLFLPVTVGFDLLISIGMIFAFVCLAFNFKYRNHKVVRVTSPKLNYFIIIGAVLFYVDVIFFVLPTVNEEEVRLTCNAETWFTVTAYTLCFGTIMAKMFRVWLIFKNPTPKMRLVISDWWLIAAVMVLLGIDLIILTVFTIIEQAGIGGELIKLTENLEYHPEEDGMMHVQYLRYYCDSKPHDIVSGFFYAYKGLLQVVALIFAFLTRKVKVKGLDDAKYIAAIIYITSIIISVLTVVEYSLDDYINAYASVFATGLTLAPTCVLLLVFVPTMVRLYKDPSGENVFVIPHATSTVEESTIFTLKSRVKELEELLSTVSEKTNKGEEVHEEKTAEGGES